MYPPTKNMGYINTVLDQFCLKQEAYKRIGNDQHSFFKFIIAFFFSTYVTQIILSSILASVLVIINPSLFLALTKHILIGFIIFITLPFLLLIILFLEDLIPYLIGVAVGGKAKTYFDFFTTLEYHYPLILPILIIFKTVLSPIYIILYFFNLNQTYRTIHKLNRSQAGLAIILNLFVILIITFVLIILATYIIALNPQNIYF